MTNPLDRDLPPALIHARALVTELIAQKVRHLVVAPGSRSAPLAYAAYCAQAAGHLSVHVKVDERSAGFFALGLAKYDGRAAAVITTSGTAVANLAPAVLEAHHGNVPLLVISADRPHELRGTGANQTTDHLSLFGCSSRLTIDLPAPGPHTPVINSHSAVVRAVAAAQGYGEASAGPVHLNTGFADPLAPTADQLDSLKQWFSTAEFAPHTRVYDYRAALCTGPVDPTAEINQIEAERFTVVVAGDGAPAQAAVLARTQGWPLLTEPSSNLAHLGLPHGPLVLNHASELIAQTTQVIVFGRPTLSRQVQQLIANPSISLVVVSDAGGPFVDPSRTAATVLYGLPPTWQVMDTNQQVEETQWQAKWASTANTITATLERLRAHEPAATAQVIARGVTQNLAGKLLVLGSSSAVRDLDLYATWPGSVTVFANRGLAGIDGMVSTTLGIATVSGLPVRAVLGDLTLLHDIGGLLASPGQNRVDVDLIVLNDQGGAIFGGLEHGRAGDTELFTTMFTTPHRADLSLLCAGYGVNHIRVEPHDLEKTLETGVGGLRVIEVTLDPRSREIAGLRLTSELRAAFEQRDSGNSQ